MIVLPTLYQMIDLFLGRTLKITAVLWLCGQVIKALQFQRGSKGTPTRQWLANFRAHDWISSFFWGGHYWIYLVFTCFHYHSIVDFAPMPSVWNRTSSSSCCCAAAKAPAKRWKPPASLLPFLMRSVKSTTADADGTRSSRRCGERKAKYRNCGRPPGWKKPPVGRRPDLGTWGSGSKEPKWENQKPSISEFIASFNGTRKWTIPN